MDVLVLGGTQWLGREIARAALAAGHAVTCLARGESGDAPDGVDRVRADRSRPGPYDALAGRSFDEVVDVSWQPGFVRGALAALADRAAHWTYVSSGSVYADTATVGGDEGGPLHDPLDAETAGLADYSGAKVTCEAAVTGAVADRALIARVGLIGGPGDHTDRTGYWVARAARAPHAPMLVPDGPDLATQVVDVRDLAAWLVRAAAAGTVGTADAVGPVLPFGQWVDLARAVGGHDGAVVPVGRDRLLAHGVQEWAGDTSLPLWLGTPGWEGFGARTGARALELGLTHRPRRDVVADTLTWEREQGLERPRRAGLTPAEESALLAEFA